MVWQGVAPGPDDWRRLAELLLLPADVAAALARGSGAAVRRLRPRPLSREEAAMLYGLLSYLVDALNDTPPAKGAKED